MLGGRLQANDVCGLQVQFGGVLDGDDALIRRDVRRHGVQEGGLAGSGSAAHDDVRPGLHEPAQQGGDRRGGEVLEPQGAGPEAADDQVGTVDGHGWHDDVDT